MSNPKTKMKSSAVLRIKLLFMLALLCVGCASNDPASESGAPSPRPIVE
jgi:hypothetical protein